MKTYNFDGYKLTLKNTNNRDSLGKFIIEYTFKKPDNTILFSGNDFHASPMHKPESKESAIALLVFLTCKPGDVEKDYFDNYTQDQLDFANSQDCENLKSYTLE
jgi:hypothetical protein